MENRSGGARKRASAPRLAPPACRAEAPRPAEAPRTRRHRAPPSGSLCRLIGQETYHATAPHPDACRMRDDRSMSSRLPARSVIPQSKATRRKPPLCLAAHQDCFPVLRSDSPCSWRRRPHSFTRPIMRHPRSIRVCIRSCAMPACPSRRFPRWRVALARCPCCPRRFSPIWSTSRTHRSSTAPSRARFIPALLHAASSTLRPGR